MTQNEILAEINALEKQIPRRKASGFGGGLLFIILLIVISFLAGCNTDPKVRAGMAKEQLREIRLEQLREMFPGTWAFQAERREQIIRKQLDIWAREDSMELAQRATCPTCCDTTTYRSPR